MTVDIVNALRVHGPLPASRLAEVLETSRPTLSRAAKAVGDQIIVRGNARRTRYAARRALRGSLAALPVYRIDLRGIPHEIARLHLTYPEGSVLDFEASFGWPLDDAMRDGWFDGLPYPLQDMRPQGFLGRNFARHHAAILQVNENPETWTDDDVLHALSLMGMDTPGDLIVGETACRLWLEQLQSTAGQASPAIDAKALSSAYTDLASHALSLGVAGSSAGGEFPKFTALRKFDDGSLRHVIVKFSGSDSSSGTERWSDLLICEQLAAQVLREALQISSTASRIHRFDERVFLEVDRFDRHDRFGRSGMVSWATLNHAFFGTAGRPWFEGAHQLFLCGWLPEEDVETIRRVWHFGQLIGNTDMHDGNLAFVPFDDVNRVNGNSAAMFRVAPIYDMLPMMYAPVRGVELAPRAYAPKLPLPTERVSWVDAARAALMFWRSAAKDSRISKGFRSICKSNADALTSMMD